MKIGMASIDENGKTHSGKAGDQTGKEVYIRDWYRYSRGWDCVIRAKSRDKGHVMALNMQSACKNDKIGYDQYQRESLLTEVKKVGYDFNKITTATETDCSALVATVIIVSGTEEKFMRNSARSNALAYTGDLKKLCLATGEFEVLTDSKYLTSGDYLLEGDILLNEGHHTAMALENGSKSGAATTTTTTTSTSSSSTSLKKGSTGDAVKTLQTNLNKVMGSGLTVDGDFGSNTEKALKAFQTKYGLTVDGIYGPKSQAKMAEVLAAATTTYPSGTVTASALNVRKGPGKNYSIVKVIYKNNKVTILEQKNGWGRIGDNQWVSMSYIKL